ncbi:MAG: cytochrome c family protein [Phyllobacteriaceae bacterium]|nr:cytochrome c family protein [Phyllobacteriaceae bacterium]
MNAMEINKMIGAVLGTVFAILTISILSDAIFDRPAPEKPGYVLAGGEAGGGEAGGGEAGGAAAAGPEDIKALLANANIEAGATVFKKCTSCHTAEKGGANKVGPNLFGVIGRGVGTHEGFSYSAAMKEYGAGKSWDYDALNAFLFAPKGAVKGTAMGFAGVKKTDERANLVAYLRSLADTPVPLP